MNVLVWMPVLTELQKEKILQALQGHKVDFYTPKNLDTPTEIVEQAEIILGYPSLKILPKAVKLKWLQLYSAGADTFVKPGVLPAGTLLTNATGAYGVAVGEHMAAQLLTVIKNLHLYRDEQLQSSWRDLGQVRSIKSCTVLVLGLGDIGGTFARIIKAFGAKIIGVKRRPSSKPDYLDELYGSDKLDELLPTADVVAMSLPGTHETTGLMNRQRFNLMKKRSILLNVGRGTAIDQDALCDALDSGHLAAAAVDVTTPEPLPPEHRMWHTKNLTITPHVSGNFHIAEIGDTVVDIFLENFKRYEQGQELLNLVDFTTGYKK